MDSAALKEFALDRVLNEDPASHTIALLGSLPDVGPSQDTRAQAIIRIERMPLPKTAAGDLSGVIDEAKLIDSTDIYSWFLAWTTRSSEYPDVKVNVICPATEVHIRKYSSQQVIMVSETPALYERIVKPYITAFPPSRTQWVENILSGVSEADKILASDSSPTLGFVILPDMKWDLMNVSNLYLMAIARDRRIRCLRDLKKAHIPMLQAMRSDARRVVQEKWALPAEKLRLYIHYQPSYYHFHVHIVNADYAGLPGMTVGQAHLLEDIISLVSEESADSSTGRSLLQTPPFHQLELSPDEGPTLLERMTLTYSVGEQHGLYASMKEQCRSPPPPPRSGNAY